ncbi:hypothetical protein BASA81_000451 [Batrachochytrium salamandrivorans]|nr:hypothetical protein BASA81_000451 [Batrachochytrium salamandrivorans]
MSKEIDMTDFFSAQTKADGATKKKKSSFGLFGMRSSSSPSPAPQRGKPPPLPPATITASYDVVEEYIYVEGLKPPPSPIATPKRKTQAPMAIVPREEDFEYAAPKSPIVSPRAAPSTLAKLPTVRHSAVDEHMFFSSGGGGGGLDNGDEGDEDTGFDNPLHMQPDTEPESHSLNAPSRSTTSKRKTGSIKSVASTAMVGSKKELDYDMVFKPSKNKQEARDENLANEEEFIQAGEFEW